VVWIPPELLNISKMIPKRKLATNKPDLFPFTGYKIINKIYGNGLMKPNKLILLKTITCRLSNIINLIIEIN
jgi:hypothetical protein